MLEGRSILLVDDDLSFTEMYGQALKAEGAIISTARNGREAIEMIEMSKPEVILLDIMMPEVSGFDVLHYIHENPNLSDIVVIVCTALVETDKYDKAKELGAVDYITKSDTMPADVAERVKTAVMQNI